MPATTGKPPEYLNRRGKKGLLAPGKNICYNAFLRAHGFFLTIHARFFTDFTISRW
jgi:hypothetical protein